MRYLDPDLLRRGLLAAVAAVWFVSTTLIFAAVPTPPPTVRVIHWANGHPMDPALLPAFGERFNAAGYRTRSGNRIEVQLHLVNSGNIRREVVRRVQTGVPLDRALQDPTVITPVVRHWLHDINHALGEPAIDVSEAQDLVRTWIGIATFREMAECLGWPQRELGYSDIVSLAADPRGWSQHACARAEWGARPLFTYTDPNRSSTGRSVLFTLYNIATGLPPERMTEADVLGDRARDYIRGFQRSVAHYVPDTLILMDEMYAGPKYGHFFFVAEDNLVHLHKGKIVGTDPQLEQIYTRKAPAGPLERPMVMIYPREGSTAHTHPAAIVRATWVTQEQQEAGKRWISFLREDAQQGAFMDEGFRPATSLPLRCPICGQYGLDPRQPREIDPSAISPPVAQRIVDSWGDVKNPGVVVFTLDSSPSMAGDKIRAAREGIIRSVDGMYQRNHVGLVEFAGSIIERVEPAPVAQNRSRVWEALQSARVGGDNALYDAIREAVLMADAAPAEPTAIRGVVVLTGGRANTGSTLHDLLRLSSRAGAPIARCTLAGDDTCVDTGGRAIDKKDVVGLGLALETSHQVHVYFIGVGDGVDIETGRLLAEATGSNFVGTTVDDLARVVQTFSEYF